MAGIRCEFCTDNKVISMVIDITRCGLELLWLPQVTICRKPAAPHLVGFLCQDFSQNGFGLLPSIPPWSSNCFAILTPQCIRGLGVSEAKQFSFVPRYLGQWESSKFYCRYDTSTFWVRLNFFPPPKSAKIGCSHCYDTLLDQAHSMNCSNELCFVAWYAAKPTQQTL